MNIELCLSVPNGGSNYVELLCKTADLLQSGLHSISIRFTYHSIDELEQIKNACGNIPVTGFHQITKSDKKFFHSNSVTHSRCINTMFQATMADICIICDYDCIPIRKHWDNEIVNSFLSKKLTLLGTPYSDQFINLFDNINAYKYQKQPNAIFLAINVKEFKQYTSSLCIFNSYYEDPSSIPLKLISNPTESSTYGLSIGKFLQLDTGYLIPEIIYKNNLKFEIFDRKVSDYKIITLETNNLHPSFAPEEYFYNGLPFAAHFRKAAGLSIKSNEYGFSQFKNDIENFIFNS